MQRTEKASIRRRKLPAEHAVWLVIGLALFRNLPLWQVVDQLALCLHDRPLPAPSASALPLANAESGTTAWFALKFGPSTFGVFDAFADEAGRQAHLNGQIAAALMANAATLLSSPPNIEKVELLAAKLPA